MIRPTTSDQLLAKKALNLPSYHLCLTTTELLYKVKAQLLEILQMRMLGNIIDLGILDAVIATVTAAFDRSYVSH